MFNFDQFINLPCIAIFGKSFNYVPANSNFAAFSIKGDFHRDYKAVNPESLHLEISSSKIVLFIRDSDMSPNYPKANPGDFIETDNLPQNLRYQIINIEPHLPGSKKLILHESSQSHNQAGFN